MENIITIETKEFYNTDDVIDAKSWVMEGQKTLLMQEGVRLSSALNVKDDGKSRDIAINSFGFMANMNNNIYENIQKVFIISSCYSHKGTSGLSVIPENLHKVTTLFTARKAITGKYANWINDKDEYLAPDENHPKWEQFVTDSLVYSLFNTKSNQSSLRQVDYKGKKWDIKNEFFWLKKQ